MGDYISRDGLIKYINENGLVYANTLKTFPAADVRPVVRARWIITCSGAYCSNCAERSTRGISDKVEWRYIPDFCPWCGAYMKMGEMNNDRP